MLTSLCQSCLRSHALAVTSCLIFFYVYTWGHSLLRHVHICFNISNGKNPKNENNARKVLKPEMLNVMSQRHRKTHTKRVFSKNPHVFANCFFKEGIAQTNAVIHHKMMVFTIPLLHAFERRKHCLQWMKIHFSAHL